MKKKLYFANLSFRHEFGFYWLCVSCPWWLRLLCYTRRWPSLPGEICISACFVILYYVRNFLGSATLSMCITTTCICGTTFLVTYWGWKVKVTVRLEFIGNIETWKNNVVSLLIKFVSIIYVYDITEYSFINLILIIWIFIKLLHNITYRSAIWILFSMCHLCLSILCACINFYNFHQIKIVSGSTLRNGTVWLS